MVAAPVPRLSADAAAGAGAPEPRSSIGGEPWRDLAPRSGGEIPLLFHRFFNKYRTKLNAVFGSWRGKRRSILEARLLFTIINAAPGN